MSDKYPSLSPYVYCANNPIKLVDPNGEEIIEVDQKTGRTTITEQKGNDILRCGNTTVEFSGNGVYRKAFEAGENEGNNGGTLLIGMSKKEGSVVRYDHNHLRTDTESTSGWPSTPNNAANEKYVDTDAWSDLMHRNPNVSLGIRHRRSTKTYISKGEIKDERISKFINR